MPTRRTFFAAVALPLVLLLLSCNSSSPTEPPGPSPACSFQVTAPADALPPEGGQLTVTITTQASCSWTVRSTADWISVAANATGTGNGTSLVNVGPNEATTLREGTLTVETQTVRVAQRGRTTCTYVLSAEEDEMGSEGGTGRFSIATGADCPWTAASDEAWVTVSPTSGTGSADVSYSVAAYTGTTRRSTSIRVNDRVMRVQQDPVRLECSFSVEPTSFESHWHGLQNVEVRLTTAAGCRWSVRSTTGWLTFSGPEEREGSDVVRVSIPVFTEDSTRRAPLEFRWESPTAGQNVWVEQGGCRYGASESARTFTAAGAIDQPVTIVTQPVSPSCSQGCPWTATSDASWITVTSPMPRAGDDMFRYTVAVNTTGMLRQGHIRVADRVIVITQNP
jgi:hypothetical protein